MSCDLSFTKAASGVLLGARNQGLSERYQYHIKHAPQHVPRVSSVGTFPPLQLTKQHEVWTCVNMSELLNPIEPYRTCIAASLHILNTAVFICRHVPPKFPCPSLRIRRGLAPSLESARFCLYCPSVVPLVPWYLQLWKCDQIATNAGIGRLY